MAPAAGFPNGFRVSDYLLTGAENAISGRDLCDRIGADWRQITAAIERERRELVPICASSDIRRPGYFLAAHQGEMKRYCRQLQHRAGEIFATRRACMGTMAQLPPEPEEDDQAEDEGGAVWR